MPGASVNPIIDYLVQSRDAVQAAIDDPAFTGAIRDIAEAAANALRNGGKLLLATAAARATRSTWPARCCPGSIMIVRLARPSH
jgi:hypothetical protein